MNYDTALLEAELAAYSPARLTELEHTVSLLLQAVDDGSTHYHNMRWRIERALAAAIERRMTAERAPGTTATIVPFPERS